MSKVLLALLLAAIVFLIGGCADTYSTRIVRVRPLPVRWNSDDFLTSGPNALTLSDVGQQGPGSPREAVFRELFDIQWGFLSSATADLDPRMLRTFGAPFWERAYTSLRPLVADSYPIVIGSQAYGTGTRVTVRLFFADKRPKYEYVILSRQAHGWTEVYSSMMLMGVADAAESEVQSLAAPLSTTAGRLGNQAQARYEHAARSFLSVTALPTPPGP